MSVLSEEELSEIIDVVWMTVLELPVDAGDRNELVSSDYLTSSIVISGAWDGYVKVRASCSFLTRAAAHMFSIGIDDVEHQDMLDTLTELTNMLGGTVKCLLPEVCGLALPQIVSSEQEDDDQSDHDWSYFSCEGEPLAVAIVQAAQGASPGEKQAA